MALNTDATFEGKLTYAFKNDIKTFANFHQSMLKSLKIGTFMGKCMSLKFRGEFCVKKLKNDAKFEEKSMCQFKI